MNLTSLAKMLFAISDMFAVAVDDPREILALTTGSSRYSLAKVISTEVAPLRILAKPPVSELKYGLPKKTTLSEKPTAPVKDPIVSTRSPSSTVSDP